MPELSQELWAGDSLAFLDGYAGMREPAVVVGVAAAMLRCPVNFRRG